MSQGGPLSTSGTLPPDVPLTFTGNTGSGSAVANNFDIVGTGSISTNIVGDTLTISSSGIINITTPLIYPYTTLVTDFFILVDSSVPRTIIPLASPVVGTVFVIKDSTGNSGTNPITVTPSGKNIDGAANYVLSSNYGSINIVYNGTEWSIF